MKITRIHTGPGTFDIETDDGRRYACNAWRETLNRQNIVILHPDLEAPGAWFFRIQPMKKARWKPWMKPFAIPSWPSIQRQWATGKLKDGAHPFELDLTKAE